jgi:hypothetical protein
MRPVARRSAAGGPTRSGSPAAASASCSSTCAATASRLARSEHGRQSPTTSTPRHGNCAVAAARASNSSAPPSAFRGHRRSGSGCANRGGRRPERRRGHGRPLRPGADDRPGRCRTRPSAGADRGRTERPLRLRRRRQTHPGPARVAGEAIRAASGERRSLLGHAHLDLGRLDEPRTEADELPTCTCAMTMTPVGPSITFSSAALRQ